MEKTRLLDGVGETRRVFKSIESGSGGGGGGGGGGGDGDGNIPAVVVNSATTECVVLPDEFSRRISELFCPLSASVAKSGIGPRPKRSESLFNSPSLILSRCS